jgi:hypothetical protein
VTARSRGEQRDGGDRRGARRGNPEGERVPGEAPRRGEAPRHGEVARERGGTDEPEGFHRQSTPFAARARTDAKIHAVTAWHGKEGTREAANSCPVCSPSIREAV